MKVVYTIPALYDDTLFERISIGGSLAIRVEDGSFFMEHPDAGLFIDGIGQGCFKEMNAPLLIHSPSLTWPQLKGLPSQSARVCLWPGLLESGLCEMVPHPRCTLNWSAILSPIGISPSIVPDCPGFISPRILATIINEAVYCLSDNIALTKDIDIAMRLGTNYPFGPIEWVKKIGAKEVHSLLTALSLIDGRYAPHPHFLEILEK